MAFTNYATITLDHTKFGGTDSTDFPFMFRSPVGTVTTVGTAVTWVSGDQFPSWLAGKRVMINAVVYTVSSVTSGILLVLTGSAGTQASPVAFCGTADLATIANGGYVTDNEGDDIWITSDAAFATKLSWEVEKYVPTTGELIIWFKVPTLNHSTDNVVYMPFGDASVTTFQGNINGTWNSAFLCVYHLPNGSSLTANDSTGNANTGTVTGATAVAGQVDGGAAFAAGTDKIAQASLPISGTGSWTISCWAKFTNFSAQRSLVVGGNTTSNRGYFLRADTSAHVSFSLSGSAGPTGSATLSTGTWYYIAVRNTAGTVQNFLNGATDGSSSSKSPNITTGTVPPEIGHDPFSLPMVGSMDEVRISNVARSADWLLSEYNNMANPFTSFTLGDTTAVAAGHPTMRRGGLTGTGIPIIGREGVKVF